MSEQKSNNPDSVTSQEIEPRKWYLVYNQLMGCNFDTMGEDTIALIDEVLKHPDLVSNPQAGLKALEATTEIVKVMYYRKTIELHGLITILRDIQEKLTPVTQRYIANFESNHPVFPEELEMRFSKQKRELTPTLARVINTDIENFIEKIRLEINFKR